MINAKAKPPAPAATRNDVIGSGAGGGTLVWYVAPSDKPIVLLEPGVR